MEVVISGKRYEVPAPATIEQKDGELYVNGSLFDPDKATPVN